MELLVDVRTPQEYAQGHLEGAILVPTYPTLDQWQLLRLRENLRRLCATIQPGQKVYTYCRSGRRAEVAADILRMYGCEAYSIGGVESGWLADELRAKRVGLVL